MHSTPRLRMAALQRCKPKLTHQDQALQLGALLQWRRQRLQPGEVERPLQSHGRRRHGRGGAQRWRLVIVLLRAVGLHSGPGVTLLVGQAGTGVEGSMRARLDWPLVSRPRAPLARGAVPPPTGPWGGQQGGLCPSSPCLARCRSPGLNAEALSPRCRPWRGWVGLGVWSAWALSSRLEQRYREHNGRRTTSGDL